LELLQSELFAKLLFGRGALRVSSGILPYSLDAFRRTSSKSHQQQTAEAQRSSPPTPLPPYPPALSIFFPFFVLYYRVQLLEFLRITNF